MKQSTNSQVTNKKLDEAVEAILIGMDNMFKNLRTENAQLHQGTVSEISKFKEENAGQHSHMQDDINYLKGQLSVIATKEELENVENRVQKLEKTVFRSN